MISNYKREDLITKIKNKDFKDLEGELKEYYKEFLTLNNSQRKLFIYPIEIHKVKEFNEIFVNLYFAVYKLVNYVVLKDPKLLEYIDIPSEVLNRFKNQDPRSFLGYSRADAVITEEGIDIFEFNFNKPQMFEDSDWFSVLFEEFYELKDLKTEKNTKTILENAKSAFKLNQNRDPKGVVLFSSFNSKNKSFTVDKVISEVFNNSEVLVLDNSTIEDFYKNLKKTNIGVMYKDIPIDLIINQGFGGEGKKLYKSRFNFFNELIQEAFLGMKLEVYPNPTSKIGAMKRSLLTLQEEKIQEKLELTKDEISAINKIPKYFNSSLKIDNKNHYVLKITGKSFGEGIVIGRDTNQDEWDSTLEELISKNKSFLFQKLSEFKNEFIVDLEDGLEKEALVTYDPFVMLDHSLNKPIVTGLASRAILREDYNLVSKFNPPTNERIYFGGIIGTL